MVMPRSALRAQLKFKHLSLLVALDDFRHVGRVAEFLHLTQPAISKALAEIEAMLDVRLFERSTRGTHPTKYGTSLIRFARETLAGLDRVGDEMNALERGNGGRVNVGTMMLAELIPKGICLMKERSPRTTVRIDGGMTDELLRRLRLGALDLVIARLTTVENVPDFDTQRLFDESIAGVSHPAHPLTKRRKLTWEELAEQPWAIPAPGSFTREWFDMVFSQYGLQTPSDLIEVGSFLPLLSLARERKALATMAYSVAHYFQGLGLIRILSVPFMPIGGAVGIITLRSRPKTRAAELLIECLTEVAKSQGATPSSP
jgi:DNA-binding transcriptional LysR family regulator